MIVLSGQLLTVDPIASKSGAPFHQHLVKDRVGNKVQLYHLNADDELPSEIIREGVVCTWGGLFDGVPTFRYFQTTNGENGEGG